MAKPPKSGPLDVAATSGQFYGDNWISQEATLEVSAQGAARTIRISLWNPYYNKSYLNNLVKVSLDGRAVFADKMQPGRTAVIDYALAAGEPLEIGISSEAVMAPDPLDERERGIVVRLSQEVA